MDIIEVPFTYQQIYSLPPIAYPLYAIGNYLINPIFSFYWNGGIISFYSNSIGNISSWSYCVVDQNGNYTCINMPIKVSGFAPSSITPLGYGFLVVCYDGSVFVIIPPTTYINNTTQIINTQPFSNTGVCGVAFNNVYPVDGGVFLYGTAPNSQNGGYVYTGFYNKRGVLVAGGLQGSYEGPNQTFVSFASLPSDTLNSGPQFLTNGLESAVVYDNSTGLYDLAMITSTYNIGGSSCGPLPPDFPFPGNFSGAYVNYSASFLLSIVNDSYQDYLGYVDSTQNLVGAVNTTFNSFTEVSVLITDGISAYSFISSTGNHSFNTAVISNDNLYVIDNTGNIVIGTVTYQLGAPNLTQSQITLYNFKHSALSSLSSKRNPK